MSKKIMALTISTMIGMGMGVSTEAEADINNGWINTNKSWNYYENGRVRTGWLNFGGDFYFLKDDGSMVTGWINLNNNWYYMNESGVMKTGWQKINGTWYFMLESGVMKTGWLKDSGGWYYLNQDGAMVFNTAIDGYYLGADGAWIEGVSGNDTTQGEANLKDVIMKTEKSTYELGTNEVKVYITNNSKKEVYYGLQYEIERLENNNWVRVPFKEEPVFIEIAYIIEPGKIGEQVIALDNLEQLTSGKYRVVKSDGKLLAEFEIH